jgi:hypothetical protein
MSRFIGWKAPADYEELPMTCRQITIPNDPLFIAAFYGAVTELTRWWNWDTGGDEEEAKRIATYWRNLLYIGIDEECGGSPDDDAPFWDDIESAAGAGEGSQWGYEDIADWAISAFLAVAGSPGAALFYKTAAPKIRLAFQSHDLGAVADVFIDGIFAFAVNTVSSVAGVTEVIEAEVDLVQFAADHSLSGIERTIRIVKAA